MPLWRTMMPLSLAMRREEERVPRGLGRNPLGLMGMRQGMHQAEAEFKAGGPIRIFLAAREQVLGRPLEIREKRFVDEKGRMQPAAALSREEFLLRRFAENQPGRRVTSPQEYSLKVMAQQAWLRRYGRRQ